MSDYPDSLIEKAADAIDAAAHRQIPLVIREAMARAVLDAVADELRADAWDQGYTYAMDDDPRALAANPYRATS